MARDIPWIGRYHFAKGNIKNMRQIDQYFIVISVSNVVNIVIYGDFGPEGERDGINRIERDGNGRCRVISTKGVGGYLAPAESLRPLRPAQSLQMDRRIGNIGNLGSIGSRGTIHAKHTGGRTALP
jgi:hypothetical protein